MGISGCDIALIYSSVDKEESEKVFGRYSAFSNVGYLVASFIFSILIKNSMSSTAFWTIIPYGVAVILTLFIKDVPIEEKQAAKPSFKESLRTIFKNKSLILLVISFALISEIVQSVSVFLNQSQYLRCGINIKYFGILVIVMQVARLSSVKAHKLSSKIGLIRSIKILYVVFTICCICLTFTSNATLTVFSIAVICGISAIIAPMILDIENKSSICAYILFLVYKSQFGCNRSNADDALMTQEFE